MGILILERNKMKFFVPRKGKRGGKWLFLKGYHFFVPSDSLLYCPQVPHLPHPSLCASLMPHLSPDKTELGWESGRKWQVST